MKKTLLATILLLTLIIFSCTPDNSQPVNVYTGTEGVEIKFLQNTPQKEVFEDSEILVMAEIWNKGAYSLNGSTGNYATLNINFDTLYFSGNQLEGFPLYDPQQTIWKTVRKRTHRKAIMTFFIFFSGLQIY